MKAIWDDLKPIFDFDIYGDSAYFRLPYLQLVVKGRKKIIICVWDHFYFSGDECRDWNSFWNARNVKIEHCLLASTKPEGW